MSILHALVLGVVQGITEFLPISSSGHLILLPTLFGWPSQPLAFDLVLHLGTSLALVIYFWKDLCAIAKNRRALLILFIGSVPAGLIGFLLADFFEQTFRSVDWVVVFLALGTVLMFLAERFYLKMWHNQRIDGLDGVTNDKALKIGLFQSLALFPGFSRSGSSISGGMLLGLNRELAAKFSFLLSVPIVLLAAIFKLINSYGLLFSDSSMHGAIVVGFFASFFAGVISIKFLLGYLKTKSLNVFLIYRLLLVIFLSLVVLR